MPTIHILEHETSCRGTLAGLLKQRGHAPQNLDTAHDYFFQLRPSQALTCLTVECHSGTVRCLRPLPCR